MSRSLNKVTLIGNLGSDPEVRSTSNGSIPSASDGLTGMVAGGLILGAVITLVFNQVALAHDAFTPRHSISAVIQ